MSINYNIRNMVKEIKTTREFKEFKQSINNLGKYKNIKKEIEALQNRQIELLSSKKTQKDKERKMKEIDQQFKILAKHPEVDNMIKSRNKFNKMMNGIYQEINKALDSEFKF